MKTLLNLFVTAVVFVVAFANILLAETVYNVNFAGFDGIRDWILIQLSLVAIFLLLQSRR